MKPCIYNLNTNECLLINEKEETSEWSIYSENQRCRINSNSGEER